MKKNGFNRKIKRATARKFMDSSNNIVHLVAKTSLEPCDDQPFSVIVRRHIARQKLARKGGAQKIL